jgi:hypothetical protein
MSRFPSQVCDSCGAPFSEVVFVRQLDSPPWELRFCGTCSAAKGLSKLNSPLEQVVALKSLLMGETRYDLPVPFHLNATDASAVCILLDSIVDNTPENTEHALCILRQANPDVFLKATVLECEILAEQFPVPVIRKSIRAFIEQMQWDQNVTGK